MSFILNVLFAIFFGGIVSYLNEANGNPKHLTLRGKRVMFCIAIIFGFVLYLFTIHFYVDCDLRSGATTACHVRWL